MKKLLTTIALLLVGVSNGMLMFGMSTGPLPSGSSSSNSVYVYTDQIIPVNQQTGYLILNPTGNRAPAPGLSVPFKSSKLPTNSAWQVSDGTTLVAPAAGTYLVQYHTNSFLPANTSASFVGTAMWAWLNVNGTAVPGSKSSNAIGTLGGLYPLTRSVILNLNKGDGVTLQVAQSGIDGANPQLGGYGDWIADSISASLTISKL